MTDNTHTDGEPSGDLQNKSMMASGVHFTSNSPDWSTPQYLVDWSAHRFLRFPQAGYVLDAAATFENKKAVNYFSLENGFDSLLQNWSARTIWLNPPYGRVIGSFIDKTLEQLHLDYCQSVTLLIPARTDTKWWFKLINSPFEKEVVFIKGRIAFGGGKSKAPFPSVLVHIKSSKFDSYGNPGRTITTYEEVIQ